MFVFVSILKSMSLKKIKQKLNSLFQFKLELGGGTRFLSFLFIFVSMLVAGGILYAANVYYDLDQGKVVDEEIRRATERIEAVGGVLAGGGAETLDSGQALQVTGGDLVVGSEAFTVNDTGDTYIGGTSTLASDATFQASAFWETGEGDLIGFDAPASASGGDQTYTLPGEAPTADYVLSTSDTGELSWVPASTTLATSSVEGDITDVGDVEEGEAFTSGGSGSTLWFHDGGNLGQLEVGSLTGNATYTLPDLGGTVAMQDGDLTGDGLLFTDADGAITQDDTNLVYDSTNNRLGIQTDNPSHALDVAGQIRGTELRFDDGTNSVVFQPGSGNATYTFPASGETSDYVLTTDGSGGLQWSDVTGVEGGLSGSGTDGRVAMWDGTDSLTDSSIEDNYSGVALTIDSSGGLQVSDNLQVDGVGTSTIAGDLDIAGHLAADSGAFASIVRSPEYTSEGETTISSGGSQNILLDPDSGVVKLATGDTIETSEGYDLAGSGRQVLSDMIPILGFDLPIRCGTACETATTVSRVLEDYPFDSAPSGATRVHKFIIRYSTTGTTDDSTWTVYNDTSGTTADTFSVPPSDGTDLDEGIAYISSDVSIPTNTDDWHLEVEVPTGETIHIYEIQLAAYNELD